MVALRKESVDRNINCNSNFAQKKHVALRKESVDRNSYFYIIKITGNRSLSARRAWIEIVYPGTWSGSILVALRKESVDRNIQTLILHMAHLSRSPQGERG